MSEKKRVCETCAWGEEGVTWFKCRVNAPRIVDSNDMSIFPLVGKRDWCRHWSETTGWDRFKEQPTQLEQAAAEIFERILEQYKRGITFSSPPSPIHQWLEEYRKNC